MSRDPLGQINARAVIVGALVDTVGSAVIGEIYLAAIAALSGATTPEDVSTIMDGSVSLQALQLVLGLAMTAIGAYVAAWVAKANERTNAFAVGVISTGIGFVFVFSAPESAPFWAEAAGLLLTIPAAFLGGEARLGLVRMKRS